MLTNEQAKQEAIKKAYKQFGFSDRAIYLMDKNGCIESQYSDNKMNLYSELFESNGFGRFRIKLLSGIEDNNGWIRIEPDGSNLPYHPTKKYKTGTLSEYGFEIDNIECASFKQVRNRFEKGLNITHYKPITPELKPIY